MTLFNVGVVLGLVPNKGLTLPFVSYGGTALVILSISLGMLMSVASQKTLAKNTV